MSKRLRATVIGLLSAGLFLPAPACAQNTFLWDFMHNTTSQTLPPVSTDRILVQQDATSNTFKMQSLATILDGSAMTQPTFRTNVGLGTGSDVAFQSLTLTNPNSIALTLKGAFPGTQMVGKFGAWQNTLDIAQTVNPSDYVMAVKCDDATCVGVRDQVYNNNNQKGSWASPTVVTGGVGYVVDEVVTFDTTAGSITGSISNNGAPLNDGTLTVTATSFTILPGMLITGAGVTQSIINSQLTGSPGSTGTYNIDVGQTIASEALTLDRCIVEPAFKVTALVPASSAIQTMTPWERGGNGRCIVDPSGLTLNQQSTTLGGSGAQIQATFVSNPPTLGIGMNVFAAITYNAIPYMVSIQPWSDRSSMGGLQLQSSPANTGPLLGVTNGVVTLTQIDEAGRLGFVGVDGTVSAPALTFGGTADGFYRQGTHDIRLALNGADAYYFNNAPWAGYTPTVTCGSGTITTLGSATGRYSQQGKTVQVEIDIQITTNGTCAGSLVATLPSGIGAQTSTNYFIPGRELNLTGKSLMGSIKVGSSTSAQIVQYDNIYPCPSDGCRASLSGTYEAN